LKIPAFIPVYLCIFPSPFPRPDSNRTWREREAMASGGLGRWVFCVIIYAAISWFYLSRSWPGYYEGLSRTLGVIWLGIWVYDQQRMVVIKEGKKRSGRKR